MFFSVCCWGSKLYPFTKWKIGIKTNNFPCSRLIFLVVGICFFFYKIKQKIKFSLQHRHSGEKNKVTMATKFVNKTLNFFGEFFHKIFTNRFKGPFSGVQIKGKRSKILLWKTSQILLGIRGNFGNYWKIWNINSWKIKYEYWNY